ncbi:hypothetical protein D3C84_630300 [compost metagenome]
MSQQFFEQRGNKLAAGGPLATCIVVAAVGVMAAIPAIEQGVGGTGIEAIDAGRVARQHRDIGDAAEVQYHPQGARFGKKRLMEGGHQGRPLTAEGHVQGAKIGDDVDAGQRRQQGRIADLQGKAEGGTVAHCLAVGADGTDILGLKPCLGKQRQGGGGKFLRHAIVGHPHAVYFVLPRGAEGVKLARRCLWPGMAERRLHPKGFPIQSDQHGIDAIHAGTRHQSDIALAHGLSLLSVHLQQPRWQWGDS